MKLSQGLIAASLAVGVMAGCRRAPELCKSDVGPISRGLTTGWVCSLPEDMPCQTTCEITGERQRSEPGVVGWETMKCCKPQTDCKAVMNLKRSIIGMLTNTCSEG
ncbi:hypothetical protein CGCF415_v008684 [Colletotrichum fructicola]|uniref:Uncharacterized protein n=1 Tax=Colletotrichum chrysophilum TaxID=1836956 RepID=A0AAD9AWT1_9PEZI|nr:uncharacterized protein CGMCC3_g15803 [Colletotrichum fructicola]KAK1854795.1 hypothetical protein CCHR01_02606 [Colletotrichum chrysophilum]KAE9568110.1 hypothetical protein CGMCC3_g15803 [Colletotrichum fructicola]KAF4884186.1 hypothetical protein CGCFRS4_v012945 [Colletotrichum fructicola]KAF4904383.1 hypothetical protein CGCF415_v008684 [Colletotrichum fructicola]KAF4931643.1 hypothetical protein CGCF245_v011132 [Colletotrichum fructicola]